MLSSISTRMRQLVEKKLPKYGRFQELERITNIKNATWQTWGRGRQRPTEQMIQAVATAWPEHAYWLVTGDELVLEGMTNPTKEYDRETQTLVEFTAKTLSMRLAIKNELFAASKLDALIDEDGKLNSDHLEEVLLKWLSRAGELKLDVESLPEDQLGEVALQGFEKILADTLANDHQLKTLEETRHRLLAQALGKSRLPE